MIHDDFYLRDDMNVSGRDTKSLLNTVEVLDEKTSVELLEFTDCKVLHYMNYDDKRGELHVAAIAPTKQLLVSSQIEGPGIRKGSPMILGPRIGHLNLTGMIMEGAECLAEEMVEDPEINGTVFLFDEQSRLPMYLFVSGVCAKTMGLRLALNTSKSSLERDIFLAKNLGDLETLHPLYVVMRGTGTYRKAIAMFANNPERISFTKTVESFIQYKEGSCIYWHMEQKRGLSAMFSFPELNAVVEKELPNFPYRPMIVVSLCDSAHIANKIFAGWYLPEDPGQHCFVTHEIPYEIEEYGVFQTCVKLIDRCMMMLERDAKIIHEWQKENKKPRLEVSMDQYTKQVERFTTKINFIVAGVKAKRLFVEFALSHYNFKSPSKYELFLYLLEACRKELFLKLSPYADWRVRSSIFLTIFEPIVREIESGTENELCKKAM